MRLQSPDAEIALETFAAPIVWAPGHRAARERLDLAHRVQPVLDIGVAMLLGTLVYGIGERSSAYAVISAIVIATVVGYGRPAVGAGAWLRTATRLGVSAIVAGWATIAITAFGQDIVVTNEHFWARFGGCLVGWMLTRMILARAERRAPERVLLVGGGDMADRLVAMAGQHGGGRLDIVGYIDERPSTSGSEFGAVPYLGTLDDLTMLVQMGGIDRVMVGFPTSPVESMLDALHKCDDLRVRVDVLPRLFEYLDRDTRSYRLGGTPIITIAPRGGQRLQLAVKRIIDITAASCAMIAVAPVMLVVAVLIKLEDGGPILYRQKRVGQHGLPFHILKFRSMVLDADKLDADRIAAVQGGEVSIADAVAAIKAERDPRITRVGEFIRKTSVDELPQFWNVFRGDMSLVGPRPLRAFEVEALHDWEHRRHLGKPGITGLWQVTGRSAVSWDERMRLDWSYVRHWSLASDLEILARTVPAVLAGDGAR